jgi:drug/metabolite transporter (DMT)-like permease
MSLPILLAVLGSALLHALWNALIKTGTSRLGATVILSLGELPIGLAVAIFCKAPTWEVMPWVIASGCTHFFYKFFLTYAYARGDLSRVYPLARGTAPLIVGLISAGFLAEPLTLHQFAGIMLLGFGILMMAGGVIFGDENRKMIPFALGSAVATALYTLIDGHGARVAGDAVGYVAWVFVADGGLFAAGILAWKGTSILPPFGKPWRAGLIAAAASYGAYGISVWAMMVAPIALVAALRETSILFAVLIGWLFFHEKISRTKALAALVIISGVILTRL